jgi:hypothetical protein
VEGGGTYDTDMIHRVHVGWSCIVVALKEYRSSLAVVVSTTAAEMTATPSLMSVLTRPLTAWSRYPVEVPRLMIAVHRMPVRNEARTKPLDNSDRPRAQVLNYFSVPD